MTKAWWKKWPDRLKFELDALKNAAINIKGQTADGLQLTLELEAMVNGELLPLLVRFPEFYPYLRFEIYAPSLKLPRHQNPFEQNLCVIPAGDYWDMDDTVAEYVLNRVPKVLDAALSNDDDHVAAIETHQGEPVSAFYAYQPESIFLFDSDWIPDSSITEGQLNCSINLDLVPAAAGRFWQIRGTVLSMSHGDSVVGSMGELLPRSPTTYEVGARWVRFETQIHEKTANEFANEVFRRKPTLKAHRWQKVGNNRVDVIAVLFPEEVVWRRNSLGWAFLVRLEHGQGKLTSTMLIRAGRAGVSDVQARIPELHPLSSKTVALIGTGCIGAPSLLEFARSGVKEIRFLDQDFVEPGTIVRWPLGINTSGVSKANALAWFLHNSYPRTMLKPYIQKIGNATQGAASDAETLSGMLRGADLLLDASAELDLQFLLSDMARESRTIYVGISATAGGWGGRIVRIRPNKTSGCRGCLVYHGEDGTIPLPPASPSGLIQPPGCSSPTFEGANFDTMQVSLMGVQMAVSAMCEDVEHAYPTCEWDVAILRLRSDDGQLVPPQWSTHPLSRHPACQNH